MKKLLTLLALAALAFVPASSFAQPIFVGSLSTPSGVTATPTWDAPGGGFVIGWTVSQMIDGNWLYEYSLRNAAGGPLQKWPSHLIIEISPNAGREDFWNFEIGGDAVDNWEINTYSSANPSNDLMPGPLYAVKINTDNGFDGLFDYSFYSNRAPTWGNFYCRDGKYNQEPVVAWNSDYLLANPTDPAQNGLLQDPFGNYIYKMLRPDTETTLVPEPGTLLMLGMGLAGLGAFRRRK